MKIRPEVAVGVASLALFAAVTGVYAVSVNNRFLHFDDLQYVVKNKAIAEGLTPGSMWWALTSFGYSDNWHPLTWISHAFDNSLADALALDWRMENADTLPQYEPFSLDWSIARTGRGWIADIDKTGLSRLVHGENTLIHAVNAVLLLSLILLMSGDTVNGCLPTDAAGRTHWPRLIVPLFFVLFWALHPLRVEVVAWASERKELLCVFFMLLTLILRRLEDVWPDVCPDSRKRLNRMQLAAFALALLSKPVAVSLPAVLFVYDWMLMRRDFRESASRAVPYAVFSFLTCLCTMASQTVAINEGSLYGPVTRMLCVVEAPVVYLVQTVLPVGLCVDYPFPTWRSWPLFAVGLLLLLLMAKCALSSVRERCDKERLPRRKGWRGLDLAAYAIAWCYVGLLPMIGIVRVGFEPHSDRYTYWIGCGAAVCGCLAVLRSASIHKTVVFRSKRIAACCMLLVLIGLSVLAIRQSLTWRDTITLFRDAVEKSHSDKFAQGLLELMERKGGVEITRGEEVLRRHLAVNGTSYAKALLGFHLSVFTAHDSDRAKAALAEARSLAAEVLASGQYVGQAYAILGYADYREGQYLSADENMKKAKKLGYKNLMLQVNEESWSEKAKQSQSSR